MIFASETNIFTQAPEASEKIYIKFTESQEKWTMQNDRNVKPMKFMKKKKFNKNFLKEDTTVFPLRQNTFLNSSRQETLPQGNQKQDEMQSTVKYLGWLGRKVMAFQ